MIRPSQRSIARLGRRALYFGAVLLVVLGVSAARADWVLNGNASLSGGMVTITPAATNQVGSAWLNSRMDLAYDFDITLQVYLGTNDSTGADGMSVVFQNDSRGTAAMGDTAGGGEWVGMHTIRPALAVEIDTYQNSQWNDPAADHIAINEFINAASGPNHAGAAPVSLGNIEDSANHLLRLVWSSATRTLTVYFDGVLRITYNRDFITNVFGGNTQLWFGVVGSTGGSYNLQRFQPLITNTNLSAAKSVNPSSVNPGEAVAYTVTIQNSGGIPAAVTQITDTLPAGFAYTPGTSSGVTSANPAVSGQTLTWSGNWVIPPAQTRTLTFYVQSTSSPGVYYNSAVVNGSDFAALSIGPIAPVLVNGTPPPAQGSKPLYLYSNPSNLLSRTPPASSQPSVNINGGNASATWILSSALREAVVINGSSGRIPLEIFLQRSSNTNRAMTVALYSASLGLIGTTGVQSYNGLPIAPAGPVLYTINIPISGDITLPTGDTLSLTITNNSSNGRTITVFPVYGSTYSRLVLDARSVIHVDSVAFYSARYIDGGNIITSARPGQTVYVRAVVGDPFGSFDISGASLQVINPLNQVVINNAMNQVYDSGMALRIYEYSFEVTSEGTWTAQVTAEEGTEGLVRHSGVATLLAASPNLLLIKSVITLSDPVHGTTNPKAIPGAVMTYTITASNQGSGPVDNNSTVVIDAMAPHTALYVGDLGQPSGPVVFVNGSTSSGLSYAFSSLNNTTDDLSFSNNNGATFDYTPVPDALGFDPQVTDLRVNPKGVFNGMSGGNAPSFTLRFRVRVE
ncbi:MAG: hypothetical protein M0036_11650 [Desulfobacteraceae bacterium]|nr:hypothetical protein [Desulfobacteraceae bacterium]